MIDSSAINQSKSCIRFLSQHLQIVASVAVRSNVSRFSTCSGLTLGHYQVVYKRHAVIFLNFIASVVRAGGAWAASAHPKIGQRSFANV